MSNSTDISYLNNLLLANMRTTYLIDALRLYLTTPMAIIGTLLNTISIMILSSKSFRNINYYKLMKVYNLISLLITFGSFFTFLFTPNILFELTISKIARIYCCNIMNYIFIMLFFYLICFIVLIICIIINLPSNLALTYTPDDQLYIKLTLCYTTTFATMPVTKVILIVSYIIEGPIVMILVIGSNILA